VELLSSLRRVLREEKGATMIIVAIAIVMIFGFAVIAIDLSLIQLAKTQLQNAADAGALAGAMAWATSNMGNVDSVRAEAIRVAGLNVAVQDIQRPVLNPDVYTLDLPNLNKVTVTTYRTKAHKDPVTLYFLKVLDPLLENKGDVTAKATAEIFPLSGTNCLKPWCIPDKWTDTDGDGIWDPGEPYSPLTGYRVPNDIGVQVTLRLNDPGASPRMGWYYPVRFPGYSGGDDYRRWIAGCLDPSLIIYIGDQLDIEPGNMVGPTRQGLEDLMALDPDAQWDPVTKTVINSDYLTSPRIIKVAASDPTLGVLHHPGGPGYVTVSKILVLFVEGYLESDIVGRFMRMASEGEICPECPQGFVFKVALVK
jgi:Flp pilus assembly protein TadG